MAALEGLGSGSARVERVQIGQFDAGGFAAFNCYRNVPSHAHISSVSIQIERADPIVARDEARKRGASFQIGVRLSGEKFDLGHVRCETQDALAAIVLQRGPLMLWI